MIHVQLKNKIQYSPKYLLKSTHNFESSIENLESIETEILGFMKFVYYELLLDSPSDFVITDAPFDIERRRQQLDFVFKFLMRVGPGRNSCLGNRKRVQRGGVSGEALRLQFFLVEYLFSHAGQIQTDLRSRLDTDHLEMLLFIRDNLKNLKLISFYYIDNYHS
ncbi:hypothetical protein BpHYR1_029119 [Brachionus plicatilis]|uniref:Uncharacterized protein n=1 Tax=Brachionus plicatilis TaxID=10195 RepID=A0A3M7PPM8_BRAPC|nr:hypothetical protein BpHYR1_029119 [Brachionus plicatilis]